MAEAPGKVRALLFIVMIAISALLLQCAARASSRLQLVIDVLERERRTSERLITRVEPSLEHAWANRQSTGKTPTLQSLFNNDDQGDDDGDDDEYVLAISRV